MRWEGNIARVAKKRNAYGILVGNAEGKRLLGRPRRRWELIYRNGMECYGLDSFDSGCWEILE
jgi:hypothetical protein